MKNFWLNLNMITKVIFVFILITIFVTFIGWLNYRPSDNTQIPVVDNSQFINRLTSRLSYPQSYSVDGKTPTLVIPLNLNELEFSVSDNPNCGGINPNMNVFYSKDVSSLMVVTNPDIVVTESQLQDYNIALETISGKRDFNILDSELKTFRTYCKFFTLNKIANIDVEYKNTNYTKSILGFSNREENIADITSVPMYIYVYAIKDDNLIQLSRSLRASFIFSANNWNQCKSKSLQSDQNKCLEEIYKNDASMQGKILDEAKDLILLFEI